MCTAETLKASGLNVETKRRNAIPKHNAETQRRFETPNSVSYQVLVRRSLHDSLKISEKIVDLIVFGIFLVISRLFLQPAL